MELMTILNNTSELANKEFATQLDSISNALKIGNAAKWDLTKAWNKILTEKLYQDDFKTTNKKGETVPMTEAQLAKEIGVSSGLFAQYKKACLLIENCDRYNEDNITMYKAYMLSSFIYEQKDKNGTRLIFDELNEFLEWCDEQGIEPTSMSDKNLAEFIKDYRTPATENEDTVEDTIEDIIEDTVEDTVDGSTENKSTLQEIIELIQLLNDNDIKELKKYVKGIK